MSCQGGAVPFAREMNENNDAFFYPAIPSDEANHHPHPIRYTEIISIPRILVEHDLCVVEREA